MDYAIAAVINIATKDDSCPICLECISLHKNTSTTNCGHCFHTTCLLKNCSMNGFICPMCRTNMISYNNDNLNRDPELARSYRSQLIEQTTALSQLNAQTTALSSVRQSIEDMYDAERQRRIAQEFIQPENQFVRRYDLELLNMNTDIDPDLNMDNNLARRTVYYLSHGGGRL